MALQSQIQFSSIRDSVKTRPVAVVSPDDGAGSGEVGVAVGKGAANGCGPTALDLEARVGLHRRMPAPSLLKIGLEAVFVERVGDDGAGGCAGVF